ncbi:MAG: hypothetical protein QOD30_2196 [Actinomycetota bacterium]|nr:hypothetical protein [Actinomycetota bacterium]
MDTGTKAVAAAAAVIAFAFALATFERWLARRRPQELAWAFALLLFTFGALALWIGASLGWAPWSFRLFYLFGAIANVPVLALGSVYLVDRRAGHVLAAVLAIAIGFAGGVLATTPVGHITAGTLPQGSDVLGVLPRVLAAASSAGGALAVFGIALWSIARRQRVVGNALIAAGTATLSASGLLNSVLGEMDAFAVTLTVGVAVLFAGFLASAASGAASDPTAPRSDPRASATSA